MICLSLMEVSENVKLAGKSVAGGLVGLELGSRLSKHNLSKNYKAAMDRNIENSKEHIGVGSEKSGISIQTDIIDTNKLKQLNDLTIKTRNKIDDEISVYQPTEWIKKGYKYLTGDK